MLLGRAKLAVESNLNYSLKVKIVLFTYHADIIK